MAAAVDFNELSIWVSGDHGDEDEGGRELDWTHLTINKDDETITVVTEDESITVSYNDSDVEIEIP